jgi:tetratricopeptide (TPR) repeat protein
MVKGGFHRLLGAEQIVLYRDDWARLVAHSRSRIDLVRQSSDEGHWVELVTTKAEILRENQQLELLAHHYDVVGNIELRDKYIKRALARRPKISPISEIQLRKMQGKLSMVKPDRIREAVKVLSHPEQLSQLARLYVDLGQWEKAIEAYCKDIARMVKDGNLFSAAYYAKEFAEEKLYNRLFESELRSRERAGDLWWQIRCLRELGWDTELAALMRAKRSEIEASGDYFLLSEMYEALGEDEQYVEVQKKIIEGTQLVDFGAGPIVGIAKKKDS